MATGDCSFYDEHLKKQIWGTFITDGKALHVLSGYGTKSASYNDLGPCIDHNSQVSLGRKLLSEVVRDPGIKDFGQQKDDQQLEPMQRPVLGASSGSWGGGVAGGSGTNP
jgi:hypothetical protein